MSLFEIAWRSIRQRSLASLLTMLSMGLGVMLVVAVLAIHGVVSESFRSNASLGYNMIVGAKGGKLQLTSIPDSEWKVVEDAEDAAVGLTPFGKGGRPGRGAARGLPRHPAGLAPQGGRRGRDQRRRACFQWGVFAQPASG